MGEQAYKSMDIAVATIKQKSYHCFYFFIIQLGFFWISSFLLMWILYNAVVALTANCVFGLCLFFFVTNGAELVDLLYISDDQAIDHFFGAQNDDVSVDAVSALSGGRSASAQGARASSNQVYQSSKQRSS